MYAILQLVSMSLSLSFTCLGAFFTLSKHFGLVKKSISVILRKSSQQENIEAIIFPIECYVREQFKHKLYLNTLVKG